MLNNFKTKEVALVDSLIREYFLQFHFADIIKIIRKNNQNTHNVYIDFLSLIDVHPQIAHTFLELPEKYIAKFESLFNDTQLQVKENKETNKSVAKISIRIVNLPICSEITPISFPLVQELQRFLSLRGIVVRTGLVKMVEKEVAFVCEKCFQTFNVPATVELNFNVTKPGACVNVECHSVKFKKLNRDSKLGNKAKNIPEITTDDYQEIRIQERSSTNRISYSDRMDQRENEKISRRSLTVSLLGEGLVDKVKVGEDIIVNGILCVRWLYIPTPKNVSLGNDSPSLELVFKANHIEKNSDKMNWSKRNSDNTFGDTNEYKEFSETVSHDLKDLADDISYSPTFTQFERNIRPEKSLEYKGCDEFSFFWKQNSSSPFRARNRILASICPKVKQIEIMARIYGMYVIKLAVALILAGGVSVSNEKDSSCIRGESHLLLVGDPGTGKSQILKFVTKIIARAVYCTGIGSTSAGLTVAAIKEGSDWGLEAGALVMADGGVCCIDELNCIREHDRATLHEAMEQQTISVAKAGIVCKLSCKTSILATANPKGTYDLSQPITVNTGMSGALISRFDLIFILLDRRDSEWDRLITSHILNDDDRPQPTKKDASRKAFKDLNDGLWSLDEIKSYFAIIRTKRPQMTEDSNRIISRYYCRHRQRQDKNAARSTVRLLESLVRLAQAHAKLMYHDTVEIQDAISAICIMECSLQSSSSQISSNNLSEDGTCLTPLIYKSTTTFPLDADEEYLTQEKIIFNYLSD